MARLMFASENERNNNDGSTSAIAVPDNKTSSKDMIVMTNSHKPADHNNGSPKTTSTTGPKKNGVLVANGGLKVRHHHVPASAAPSDNRLYLAKKVLVSTAADSSTVARLRSKFNATNDADKLKSRSLTSNGRSRTGLVVEVKQPAAVGSRTLPQRASKPVTAQNTTSVLEVIRFFEQDASKVPAKKPSSRIGSEAATLKESILRSAGEKRLEQDDNRVPSAEPEPPKTGADGQRFAKPSVQPKPVVLLHKVSKETPKPVVLLRKVSARKENRSAQQPPKTAGSVQEAANNVDSSQPPASIVVIRQFEHSLYHAPKLLLRKDLKKEKNLSSDYQVIMTKSKRLSIAKDFALESVLNADMDNRSCEVVDDSESAIPNSDSADTAVTFADSKPCDEVEKTEKESTRCDKMANSSFLHKYLEQCLEGHQVKKAENVIAKQPDVPARNGCADVPVKNCSVDVPARSDPNTSESPSVPATLMAKNIINSSALHDTLLRKLKNSTSNEHRSNRDENPADEVIYEDLPSPKADDHENHYMDIREVESNGTSNVYDDVIYAQLYHNGEVETYETISSERELYGDPQNEKSVKENNVMAVAVEGISRSESDSSFEHANSLYDVMKPTSDFSSATASTFSSSNDCININIESPYVYVSGSKSSSSDIGEDEVTTYDWDSDENDHEEIIVYESNRKRKFKKRKFKFSLRQKDYAVEPSSVVEENPDVMDEFFDDFDDSSSDGEPSEMNGHADAVNHLNKPHSTANSHSQNIYGLVEKARKTVRKSWSSLNQIRKLSVGNISNNFQLKIPENHNRRSKSVSVEEISVKNGHSVSSGGSIRWTSLKSKLRPRYSTINSSTSIFYLNPEDLCFDKSGDAVNRKQNNATNRRRRMTCIELRPTRPTSPPPPPPVDRPKSTDIHSISNSNIYSDRSNSSYESRNSMSGADASFDLNSSRSSDLHLRFADEPLYQFYAESVVKQTTNASSMDCLTDSDGYEEIASTTSRPSAMELIIPSPNGHGQHRTLWCEVEEVKNSGILDTLSPSRQRLQEAIFEIITSEASYYKSLSVLDKIFASNPLLKDETTLTKNDWKILFGNVAAVRKCSEKLLAALETCWQDSILLTGLCNVIYKHASENFRIYVKYCSNQIYIDRTLKTLKEQSSRVMEIVSQLEANPMCQSLSLHSFLMLPMQRITRMPLLLDAVLSKMDPLTDSDEYKTYQITLATLNKIVKECNETARKLERYEEMLLLSGQLEFSRKDVKMFSVASSSRWLIRSGPMVHINPQDIKLTFTRKLTKQATKFYFFLFNDILVVAKKKSEDTYVVFDYCARNMIQMSLLDDNCANAYKYLLMLTILENHEGKTVEMILSCDSDSTRQRWLEATSSHLTSDNPEEKLYEEWDCPQVSAIHAYTALQPDELSLQAGDVVKILKKTTDGWCHGERIRDGSTGWFPGNYTVEIASQHMRAKNLRLRHRLLTLSGNYVQYQLHKKS